MNSAPLRVEVPTGNGGPTAPSSPATTTWSRPGGSSGDRTVYLFDSLSPMASVPVGLVSSGCRSKSGDTPERSPNGSHNYSYMEAPSSSFNNSYHLNYNNTVQRGGLQAQVVQPGEVFRVDLIHQYMAQCLELRAGSIALSNLSRRDSFVPPVWQVCRRLGVNKLSEVGSEQELYDALVDAVYWSQPQHSPLYQQHVYPQQVQMPPQYTSPSPWSPQDAGTTQGRGVEQQQGRWVLASPPQEAPPGFGSAAGLGASPARPTAGNTSALPKAQPAESLPPEPPLSSRSSLMKAIGAPVAHRHRVDEPFPRAKAPPVKASATPAIKQQLASSKAVAHGVQALLAHFSGWSAAAMASLQAQPDTMDLFLCVFSVRASSGRYTSTGSNTAELKALVRSICAANKWKRLDMSVSASDLGAALDRHISASPSGRARLAGELQHLQGLESAAGAARLLRRLLLAASEPRGVARALPALAVAASSLRRLPQDLQHPSALSLLREVYSKSPALPTAEATGEVEFSVACSLFWERVLALLTDLSSPARCFERVFDGLATLSALLLAAHPRASPSLCVCMDVITYTALYALQNTVPDAAVATRRLGSAARPNMELLSQSAALAGEVIIPLCQHRDKGAVNRSSRLVRQTQEQLAWCYQRDAGFTDTLLMLHALHSGPVATTPNPNPNLLPALDEALLCAAQAVDPLGSALHGALLLPRLGAALQAAADGAKLQGCATIGISAVDDLVLPPRDASNTESAGASVEISACALAEFTLHPSNPVCSLLSSLGRQSALLRQKAEQLQQELQQEWFTALRADRLLLACVNDTQVLLQAFVRRGLNPTSAVSTSSSSSQTQADEEVIAAAGMRLHERSSASNGLTPAAARRADIEQQLVELAEQLLALSQKSGAAACEALEAAQRALSSSPSYRAVSVDYRCCALFFEDVSDPAAPAAGALTLLTARDGGCTGALDLLWSVAEQSPRLRSFARAVVSFAKSHGLYRDGRAHKGDVLWARGWVVLLLHFLLRHGFVDQRPSAAGGNSSPPISLPLLLVSEENASLLAQMSVCEMLLLFFRYYAHDFSVYDDVAAVSSERVLKSSCAARCVLWRLHIEDPLLPQHAITANISKAVQLQMFKAFRRAAFALQALMQGCHPAEQLHIKAAMLYSRSDLLQLATEGGYLSVELALTPLNILAGQDLEDIEAPAQAAAAAAPARCWRAPAPTPQRRPPAVPLLPLASIVQALPRHLLPSPPKPYHGSPGNWTSARSDSYHDISSRIPALLEGGEDVAEAITILNQLADTALVLSARASSGRGSSSLSSGRNLSSGRSSDRGSDVSGDSSSRQGKGHQPLDIDEINYCI